MILPRGDPEAIVNDQSDVSDDHLPPQPNAETGEPRPPRAPVYGTIITHVPKFGPSITPAPTSGGSPTLETYAASNRATWSYGAGALILIVALLTIFYGVSWVMIWWAWATLALVATTTFSFTRSGFYAAGADWVRNRKEWVKTYELTEIEMHVSSAGTELLLKDSSGRSLNGRLADLQANRDLWDFVYNGIRHSIAHGATANRYARDALKLGGET
jgi:hypothetical protein